MEKLNIENHKDEIYNLNLDIKIKMELINFINSIKSEILTNIENNLNNEYKELLKMINIYIKKEDIKNINEISSDILFNKKTKEYFNNLKNKTLI